MVGLLIILMVILGAFLGLIIGLRKGYDIRIKENSDLKVVYELSSKTESFTINEFDKEGFLINTVKCDKDLAWLGGFRKVIVSE